MAKEQSEVAVGEWKSMKVAKCEALKLVCIENAAGLEDERVGQYESIGFWEVCFG